MVIRVSGYPGSGKSTLSKRLADELGYEYHYAGGIFRNMAEKKGLSIEEFYKNLANDPGVEKEIDQKQIAMMAAQDNLVMEGRVVPFLPCPFPTKNILILVTPEESARRGLDRPENKGRTLQDILKLTEERVADERRHYKKLYNVDNHLDSQHFDIVVDTTDLSIDETFNAVVQKLKTT